MKLRNIVATMKIVHSIKKPPKLNYANMPVFKSLQILMSQLLSGLQ